MALMENIISTMKVVGNWCCDPQGSWRLSHRLPLDLEGCSDFLRRALLLSLVKTCHVHPMLSRQVAVLGGVKESAQNEL